MQTLGGVGGTGGARKPNQITIIKVIRTVAVMVLRSTVLRMLVNASGRCAAPADEEPDQRPGRPHDGYH